LEEPPVVFALLVLFFLLRRIIQTRRPARRARTARPPTTPPAITPTFDFLADEIEVGVDVEEAGVVDPGVVAAGVEARLRLV
jgi:hypothetical protein